MMMEYRIQRAIYLQLILLVGIGDMVGVEVQYISRAVGLGRLKYYRAFSTAPYCCLFQWHQLAG